MQYFFGLSVAALLELESRPEIRDLSLRSVRACASSPFTLQPSALLRLETFRSVHMDPNTLRDVIPSRLSRLHLGYADVVPLQAIAVRPVQGSRFRSFRGMDTARSRC